MSETTEIKKRLLSLQAELQQRLDKTQSEERKEVREDQDTDAQLWEASDIRDGLDDEASNELRQVNIALARLEAGDYGICTDCGEPIDPKRLEAVPYAVTCISCASKSG